MTFVEAVPKYIEARKELFSMKDRILTFSKNRKNTYPGEPLPQDIQDWFDRGGPEESVELTKPLVEHSEKIQQGYEPTPEEQQKVEELFAWLDEEVKLREQ